MRTVKHIAKRDRKIFELLADMDGKYSARYARKPEDG